MKRLILEMGSGADLYGMDYTNAAVRAFNDAVRRVEEVNKEKMGALTGGMQMPPGMKMPF